MTSFFHPLFRPAISQHCYFCCFVYFLFFSFLFLTWKSLQWTNWKKATFCIHNVPELHSGHKVKSTFKFSFQSTQLFLSHACRQYSYFIKSHPIWGLIIALVISILFLTLFLLAAVHHVFVCDRKICFKRTTVLFIILCLARRAAFHL